MRTVSVSMLAVIVTFFSPAYSKKRTGQSNNHATLRNDLKISEVHYLAAVDFFRKGNYSEAARLFIEAYKESGKASLLYNVGVCYERMGLLRRALEYYDRFFAAYPAERHKLAEHLEHLKQRVRSTFLTFSSGVPGARVYVNGRVACTLPCTRLRVTPNERLSIRVEYPGYLPYTATVTVLPGATQDMPVALVRKVAVKPSSDTRLVRQSSSPDMWSVVFASGAVVLGITSGTLGYVALGYADEYSVGHDGSDETMARRLAAASDAALAGALVLGAVAVYRYLHDSKSHDHSVGPRKSSYRTTSTWGLIP